MIVCKPHLEHAIEYDGVNIEEIREYLSDVHTQISPWIDGMLRIDTEHGRLTVRKGEMITKDFLGNFFVYTKGKFEKLFIEEHIC